MHVAAGPFPISWKDYAMDNKMTDISVDMVAK